MARQPKDQYDHDVYVNNKLVARQTHNMAWAGQRYHYKPGAKQLEQYEGERSKIEKNLTDTGVAKGSFHLNRLSGFSAKQLRDQATNYTVTAHDPNKKLGDPHDS